MSKAVDSIQGARNRAAQQQQEAIAGLAALRGMSGPVIDATRSRLQAVLETAQATLKQLDQVLARVTPVEERPDYTEAWSFVLQYSEQIDRIFWRSCKHFSDAEDRRQDFIERIVTRHASFVAYASRHPVRDQTALVLNWLKDQLLASKTTARKRVRWREQLEAGTEEKPSGIDLASHPDTPESLLATRSMEHLVQTLYDGATDAQQEAIQLFLEEASPATLKALGWTPLRRDQALASLRPLLLKQVA